MFQDGGPAVSWLENHFGIVATLIGWVATICGFVFGTQASIKQIQKQSAETCARVEEIDTRITSHLSDYRRHIDPERDDRRWQDLRDRLSRIEGKLDKGQ